MSRIHNSKQIIIIGHNHYGRVPMIELIDILKTSIIQPHNKTIKCKRCGSTINIMLNGYCFDCEEELSRKYDKKELSRTID